MGREGVKCLRVAHAAGARARGAGSRGKYWPAAVGGRCQEGRVSRGCLDVWGAPFDMPSPLSPPGELPLIPQDGFSQSTASGARAPADTRRPYL